MLNQNFVVTKNRLMIFNTIFSAKINYVQEALAEVNRGYNNKWKSLKCRMIKSLYSIKTNVIKNRLFEFADEIMYIEHLSLKAIKV
jgi:hypothetical protein